MSSTGPRRSTSGSWRPTPGTPRPTGAWCSAGSALHTWRTPRPGAACPPATGSVSAPSWRTRTISRPSPGPTVRPRRSIRRRPRPSPPSSGSSWTSPPERSPLMSFCATRRRMGRVSGRRTAYWPRSSTTSSPKRATGSFSPASPWRASWASPTSPIFSPPSRAPGSWWW